MKKNAAPPNASRPTITPPTAPATATEPPPPPDATGADGDAVELGEDVSDPVAVADCEPVDVGDGVAVALALGSPVHAANVLSSSSQPSGRTMSETSGPVQLQWRCSGEGRCSRRL